jgi:hypothetical protein
MLFMDNNINNVPVQSTVTPPPQPPPTQSGIGMTFALIIAVVIIALVLVMSGYLLFFHQTHTTIHNAQVYNEPTPIVSPTVTPLPPNYQINPKDTSDNAINQDTQATGQDLNNVDNALNSIDQSFNDQQTNLQ